MPVAMPTSGGSRGANIAGRGNVTYGSYTPLKNPITINQATGERGNLYPTGGATGAGDRTGAGGAPADDYTKRAMDRLSAIAEGKEVPLDAATQANMLSKAQESTSAAEQAQNESLMASAAAGGANPNDPSLQAAKRQAMAGRQGANQQAQRDIELATRQQNFAAMQGAAESLAGFGQAQQRINAGDPNNPANAQLISNPMPGPGGVGASPLGMQYNPAAGQMSQGQMVNQAAMNRLAPAAAQSTQARQPAGPSLTEINRQKRAMNAANANTQREMAYYQNPESDPVRAYQDRMRNMQ